MNDVVIVATTRTAIGSFQGGLSAIPAPDLEAGVQPNAIDEMILGQVLTAGSGQNPVRQAAIKPGLPPEVPAMTLNKVCVSGLTVVQLAAQAIRCDDAELVIAGGQGIALAVDRK